METNYRAEHARLERANAAWSAKLADIKAKAARWQAENELAIAEMVRECGYAPVARALNLEMDVNAFDRVAGITGTRHDWLVWLGVRRLPIRKFSEWLELYEEFAAWYDARDERQAADDMSRGQG